MAEYTLTPEQIETLKANPVIRLAGELQLLQRALQPFADAMKGYITAVNEQNCRDGWNKWFMSHTTNRERYKAYEAAYKAIYGVDEPFDNPPFPMDNAP